jgi:hypothetical protein
MSENLFSQMTNVYDHLTYLLNHLVEIVNLNCKRQGSIRIRMICLFSNNCSFCWSFSLSSNVRTIHLFLFPNCIPRWPRTTWQSQRGSKVARDILNFLRKIQHVTHWMKHELKLVQFQILIMPHCFCFCFEWDWSLTSGLHACREQALYCLSHTFSPFFSG